MRQFTLCPVFTSVTTDMAMKYTTSTSHQLRCGSHGTATLCISGSMNQVVLTIIRRQFQLSCESTICSCAVPGMWLSNGLLRHLYAK